MKYAWKIPEEETVDLIETLLKKRGVSESEAVSFLNPDWDAHTHDPFLFTRMNEAVERTFFAFQAGEHIRIHGDYDADGVSGSALLYRALKEISDRMGFSTKIDVFLPDRERDGYGVAMHTIERFHEEGVQLLITVDCGIGNAEELNRAHTHGMSVIVCDHHQLAKELPKHAFLIHPLVPGESYPNKTLCGTGVAFKFASALFEEARRRGADFPKGHEKWFLDLVAIATVTDVMPILGENRVLEKFGLLVLNKTRRHGIRKIVDVSRTQMGSIDTQAIGFQIGPRLNAAGRIKSAEIAFRALASETEEEAAQYAQELELLNRERQRISDAAFTEARQIAKTRGDVPVHVVWSETWNPGIVGLVAGKLVTEFGVPAFAFTRVGEHYVGSGRSTAGLHLVEAMQSCGDIFVKAGGHPQACGLTIASSDLIETFVERVTTYAKDFFQEESLKLELDVDAHLPISQVNWELYEQISKLEPFGEGNPRPVFYDGGLQVVTADAIGRGGKHVLLHLKPSSGQPRKFIGFGFGEWASQLAVGDMMEVVYEIDVNEWNGRKDLQFRIVDLRKR